MTIPTFLCPDVLNIPEAMELSFATIKAIAWILFSLLFVLAIIRQTVKTSYSDEKTNFSKIIITALLISIGLGWYRHIFMKIVALCEAIGMCLCDTGKIHKLISFVFEESQAYVEGTVGGSVGKTLGMMNYIGNFFRPKVLILGFLSVCVSIVEPVLLTVRYALLCVLYAF